MLFYVRKLFSYIFVFFRKGALSDKDIKSLLGKQIYIYPFNDKNLKFPYATPYTYWYNISFISLYLSSVTLPLVVIILSGISFLPFEIAGCIYS